VLVLHCPCREQLSVPAASRERNVHNAQPVTTKLCEKEFFRTVMVCAHAHASPPAPPCPPLSERRECPCPCDTPPASLPPSPPPQTAAESPRTPPATDRQKTGQCRRWRSPCRRSAGAPWPRRCRGGRSLRLGARQPRRPRPRAPTT